MRLLPSLFDDILERDFHSSELIRSDPTDHVISLAVPGYNKDSIEVTLDEKSDILTIVGKTKDKVGFKRQYEVPNSDPDRIVASVLDGILTVTAPKVKKVKRIPVS